MHPKSHLKLIFSAFTSWLCKDFKILNACFWHLLTQIFFSFRSSSSKLILIGRKERVREDGLRWIRPKFPNHLSFSIWRLSVWPYFLRNFPQNAENDFLGEKLKVHDREDNCFQIDLWNEWRHPIRIDFRK